jgi:hypothetical protein
MNSGGPKQGLTWQEKVAKKRALQAEALAAVHNGALSSTVEPQIGALTKISSASAVVDRIVSGEATSQAVTEAFIKRSVLSMQ